MRVRAPKSLVHTRFTQHRRTTALSPFAASIGGAGGRESGALGAAASSCAQAHAHPLSLLESICQSLNSAEVDPWDRVCLGLRARSFL